MALRAKNIVPVIALLALASCASEENWQPTIDIANDRHASHLQTDLAQCKQLADRAADRTHTMAEDTGIGMVGGAAGGALLGAITGGAATGAAVGAVTGTGVGLGGSAISTNEAYKHAYIHCMEHRGHPVIN